MGEYFLSSLIDPLFRQARPSSAASSTVAEPSPPATNLDHDKSLQPTIDDPNSLQHTTDETSSVPTLAEATPDRLSGSTRVPAADTLSNDVVQPGNMNDQDSHHHVHHDDGEGHLEPDTTTASSPYNPSSNTSPAMTAQPPLDQYDRQLQELPEDDGMMVLRRKIHAIRDTNATSSEKARLIHKLMTESYDYARKQHSNKAPNSLPRLPPSSPSPEQPTTPSSPQLSRSFDRLSLDHSPLATAVETINIDYNLTPADLEPTYAPRELVTATNNEETTSESPPIDVGDDDSDYSEENVMTLGCQHYKRNVKLQCYTCKRWYTCRFCHDQVEDHTLERRKTENMLCMLCGLPQPASQWCSGCDERAASYYCEVCKLWDNDSSKSIYHCNDCGICRIGQGIGKDFYHCKTCSVCIPISIENTHRCIERSTQCDCPICGEYMFTSPETVVFMRCGHSIHKKCYSDHAKVSYRCPICSKSIMNMEARFRNLDRTIESQPMPPEFKDTRAMVYCNDCGAKSDVPYHWLGLKCDLCESYNTVQIKSRNGPGEADDEGNGGLPISYNLVDRACDSITNPNLVAEPLNGDSDFWRPSTSHSSDRRSSRGVPRSRPQQISPTVGNYFDLSRDDTAWAPSIFSSRRSDGGSDTEEVGFWATSPLRNYSFFRSRGLPSDDGQSESESESTSEEEEEDDIEEDDDDDDIDPIKLFGHR